MPEFRRLLGLAVPLVAVLSCTSSAPPNATPAPKPTPEPAAAAASPAPQPPKTATSGPVAEALAIADEYTRAYYQEFPEEAFENGYPDAPQDRFSDRGAAARAAWQKREDGWLARLEAVGPASLSGTDAALPHAYLLERLRAAKDLRVCRWESWNVNPTISGWQNLVADALANQPVGTAEERAHALARVRDVARYVDTDRANLAEGLAAGSTAARSSVEKVVEQLDEILASKLEDSPFDSPAARDESGELAAPVKAAIEGEILPAVRRHRDFLANEYLPKARAAAGVSANPDGAACYAATVRFWTSLPLGAQELHDMGLAQMAKIDAEMKDIAKRSFATDDVPSLLAKLRSEPRYSFANEKEILDFIHSAIARAEAASPQWFGFVPKAGVIVRPYPAFQKATGGGSYSSGAPGQPGVYQIGTYEPTKLPRAGLEATTFHETYPGHHLQGAVALQRKGLHPALRYFFSSGTGEGWALYTERLADEMKLYSSDLDRLGMLSNEALRAARLVVDSGIHALGWDRQKAIDYLLAHTALAPGGAAAQIDRYIGTPGQATAYMVGNLEIRRLRELAQAKLGAKFDIRVFHDRVLEDGAVTLPMLREKIERWIAAGGG